MRGKVLKRIVITLTAVLVTGTLTTGCGEIGRFTWSNPISNYTPDGKGLRDPFILKEGKYWYMTGTMSPYGIVDGQHPEGVPLYRSSDLKKWVFVGTMVARPDDSENKWYQERYWAPELFALNGKYYITVNRACQAFFLKIIRFFFCNAASVLCILRSQAVQRYPVLSARQTLLLYTLYAFHLQTRG